MLPAILVALWWVSSADNVSIYFPPLREIMASFADLWLFERWSADVFPSLKRMGIGLLLATLLGIFGGAAVGLSSVINRMTAPYVEFLRAIPPTALIPAAIVMIGIGDEMKIVIVAFGTVWPILLSSADGVRSVHPTLLATVRSFSTSRSRLLFRVILPAASPQISAGLRTAIGLGVILIVVSEMVASTNGIGHFVLNAQRTFAITDMWSGIILLGLLGVALNGLYVLCERLLLHWYFDSQKVER